MPVGLKPFTCYKHWRADGFLTKAMQAREQGDLKSANLGLRSALALNPTLRSARIQLARLLVEGGEFTGGIQQAELAGLDGAQFGHDTLLYAGSFDGLLPYCAWLMNADRSREGVWLQSAFMISRLTSLAVRERVHRSLPAKPNAASLMLDAVLLSADGRMDDAIARLAERERISPLTAADTLLGLELFMHAGDPSRAWIWFNRHRAGLSEFDAPCGAFRIASARDHTLALGILKSFGNGSLSDTRWVRLAAAVTEGGDEEMADVFCRMLANERPQAQAPLAVSAWALLMLQGHEEKAAAWDTLYRRACGQTLPILIGRKLKASDHAERTNAIRLLCAMTPLPREMTAALLMR